MSDSPVPAHAPAAAPAPALELLDLGRIDYREAWALQLRRVEERAAGRVGDALLFCEHPPVITCGRGTKPANLLAPDVPVVEIERGGDVTWHGPGQLVGYPILLLPPGGRDLHRHLRWIEAGLIRALARLGVAGEPRAGLTGVWVGARKLASIGIAVRRWVTYHGFALNVEPDLAAFARIRPCGLDASVMTSLAAVLGRSPGMAAAREAVARAFALPAAAGGCRSVAPGGGVAPFPSRP
ncbi:MAG: lipoyl(octanoyl) transferase LipB [Planctomycetes bacterium]|nr:lipoyl(octanoyl) transferase LipB [Planctomycetota bacterium]